MREPRQRLLSFCASHYRVNGTEYRQCAASTVSNNHLGVAAAQIAGVESGNSIRRMPSLTPAQLSEAISRLRHSFAFIGLQSEWDASLDLFHAQVRQESRVGEAS